MGVLPCDRRGCSNIMCDWVSMDFGHLCDDCLEDLIRSGPYTVIDQFMDTPKHPERWREQSEERYKSVFKNRHEVAQQTFEEAMENGREKETDK